MPSVTTVTVRPNSSVSDHAGYQLIGGGGSPHFSVNDNSDATYIRLPGVNGPFFGTGGWDYVLLGFPAPVIPAGNQLRTVWVVHRTMEETGDNHLAVSGLYTDIRKTGGGVAVSSYGGDISDLAVANYTGAYMNVNPSIGQGYAVAETSAPQVLLAAYDVSEFVYEVYLNFEYTDIPVPTLNSPALASTQTTGTPALQADVDQNLFIPGMTYIREFQLATDAGFTTNLRTQTDATYRPAWSASDGAIVLSQANRLAQGTWYVRCRTKNVHGEASGWSAVNTFIVSHPPVANSLIPTGNADAQYDTTPTFDWGFGDTDTSDFQTAYQVQFWKLSAPTLLHDTGKIVSGTTDHTFNPVVKNITNKQLTANVATLTSTAHGFLVGQVITVAGVDATFNGTYVLTAVAANTFSYAKTAANVALTAATGTGTRFLVDTTWKDVDLRWRVRLYDRDDVAGPWSLDQGFKFRDLPVVAITSPANGSVVAVASPPVVWTFTAPGRTQVQWKVDIYNTTPNPDVLLESSGWRTGADTTWTPTTPVMSVGPTFSAVVTVIDSSGLTGTSTNTFTATYTPPTAPAFSIDGTTYPLTALRMLDWSGTAPAGTFYSWRIYRRNTGTTTWKLLGEIFDGATRFYRDFTAPSQTSVDYVVAQVITQLGGLVESAYAPVTFAAQTLLDYHLVCPDNYLLNMTLYSVESESFSDEQEMATQNVPGRGRITEYGTRFGQAGQISGTFRDQYGGPTARAQRLALEALRSSGFAAYLTNPFGDVWRVALASADITRIAGMGLHEATEWSISYTELSGEG